MDIGVGVSDVSGDGVAEEDVSVVLTDVGVGDGDAEDSFVELFKENVLVVVLSNAEDSENTTLVAESGSELAVRDWDGV